MPNLFVALEQREYARWVRLANDRAVSGGELLTQTIEFLLGESETAKLILRELYGTDGLAALGAIRP